MAKFTVRVELHDADSADYDLLHEKMEKSGYNRDIYGSNNKLYRLPTAEYSCSKIKSASEIRDEVIDIADLIKDDFDVLVTESASRAWRLSKV